MRRVSKSRGNGTDDFACFRMGMFLNEVCEYLNEICVRVDPISWYELVVIMHYL